MNVEQSMRIAVAFARETAKAPNLRLCSACVDVLAVTGAGITVIGAPQSGPICVSNSSIAALENLQFTIAQGPCRDAFQTGKPVHAPRLDTSVSARWPSFVELAHASGIGAVFAYPLVTHSTKVGVLTLYQQSEGALSTAQHDDSIAISEVLTETVLSLHDNPSSDGGGEDPDDVIGYRAEIYQASGMVAVQLSVPVSEAMLLMRAHAFAHGQPVREIAKEIVARRLRLTDDRPPSEE